MISIQYAGRLGNNLFQYVAAYIFAKKFNLKLLTEPKNQPNFHNPLLDFGSYFSLPKKEDGNVFNNKIINVDDDNFLSLLTQDVIEEAEYHFVGYYQLKDFILNNRDEIKKMFTITKKSEPKGDEVFVMYRIGDINNMRQMLPIEYFIESLDKLKCSSGYISSDSLNHPNINFLCEKYNLKKYDNPSSIETMDFAKDFNNLVLSEGSFSWWIGFLSSANNVIYNERDRFWHGDMFVIPEWKNLKYDWDPSCIGPSNNLKCHKIIKL